MDYDPFQSEAVLHTYIKSNEFKYELRAFTETSGNNIEFVRVLSVKQVIIKMVKDLAENNMLQSLPNIQMVGCGYLLVANLEENPQN